MNTTEPRLDPAGPGTHGARHTNEVVEPVLASPLFAGLDRAEIVEILDHFDEQSFNAGHSITLEGYRGSDFYIIAGGRAAVTVDGAPVATLNPGDYFGEMAVLGDGARMATVNAETPLRCLVLPNNGLEAVIAAHPHVGVNLLHQVVVRFQDLNELRDVMAERHLVRR
jgi:CRP-like cAMP-binding protein